jgi:DNA mismatch repair protein MSH2
MLDTRKDGVRFTSAKMKKLSRAYTELVSNYNKLQESIVENALNIVGMFDSSTIVAIGVTFVFVV